jgi:hypothetical protein
VYVRSHGRDFNVVPPELIRRGLERVYAIGPALDGEHERLHVLVQDFSGRRVAEFAEVVRMVEDAGGAVLWSTGTEYGLPCARLSATFSAWSYPFSVPPSATFYGE